MRKFCFLLLAISFLSVSRVSAADLSVALEQPKSPTNQNTFDINFVALDTLDRAITVKCFKKGPSDGEFFQFGSAITLTVGGNTDNCHVDGSLVTGEGTYQFYVNGTADAETVDSSIVSVDYKTSGPGTPGNYAKENPASCEYRIKFKTNDDSGKTVKVELYRSENTSFDTNDTTRVDTILIGSNTESQFVNFVSDCNKTYYYALRAFDNAGNGSGVIGDSITKTTIKEVVITPTPGVGAIQVAGGGQVLGEQKPTEETTPTASEEAGQVEGATTQARKLMSKTSLIILVIFAFIGLVIVYLRRRK
jgi:hypothetical protein